MILRLRFGGRQAVERKHRAVRIDRRAFAGRANVRGDAIPDRRGLHHRTDGQIELLRKLPVALVVRGHGHDGPGAVAHQHVVRDPHGNPLAVDRVDRVRAGEHAGFFLGEFGALQVGLPADLGAVLGDGLLVLVRREHVHQRMLGREHHVRRAEERVGPRGEHGQLRRPVDAMPLRHGVLRRVVRLVRVQRQRDEARRAVLEIFQDERDVRALAAADPVALQQLDRLRPVQAVEFVDEPFRVRRDPQHPLAHRAALDGKPADLALAVHDFLVRQHRAQRLAPVHRRFGDERQPHAVRVAAGVSGNRLGLVRRRVEPRFVQQPENPLRPLEITGVGRVDLAVPVVVEPDAL